MVMERLSPRRSLAPSAQNAPGEFARNIKTPAPYPRRLALCGTAVRQRWQSSSGEEHRPAQLGPRATASPSPQNRRARPYEMEKEMAGRAAGDCQGGRTGSQSQPGGFSRGAGTNALARPPYPLESARRNAEGLHPAPPSGSRRGASAFHPRYDSRHCPVMRFRESGGVSARLPPAIRSYAFRLPETRLERRCRHACGVGNGDCTLYWLSTSGFTKGNNDELHHGVKAVGSAARADRAAVCRRRRSP